MDTGNGVFQINGREIHDEHLVGRAPLADVLRWSSNIGIVKFAQRLSPRDEFETFRDFGFGMPTGVPYPTESGGVLRAPKSWSNQSANSMAMGYEIAVTPLQLAAAYAAFANGGELIEPALVKEVTAPNGEVLYRHAPRIVRRVMSDTVADKVRHMLLDVVDEGTALQAALDNYLLAGKTGTPRGTVKGHYVAGRYNPNFVGLFPGDNPQYVDRRQADGAAGRIFAAETAAPVTKAILEAAIAARNAALDRGKLATSVAPRTTTVRTTRASRRPHIRLRPRRRSPRRDFGRRVPAAGDSGASAPPAPLVITLPLRPAPAPARVARPVPDVRGLGLRDAVRSLHNAGFRVQLTRGTTGRADNHAGSRESSRRPELSFDCSSTTECTPTSTTIARALDEAGLLVERRGVLPAPRHRYHRRQPRCRAGRPLRRGARDGARRPRLSRCRGARGRDGGDRSGPVAHLAACARRERRSARCRGRRSRGLRLARA